MIERFFVLSVHYQACWIAEIDVIAALPSLHGRGMDRIDKGRGKAAAIERAAVIARIDLIA